MVLWDLLLIYSDFTGFIAGLYLEDHPMNSKWFCEFLGFLQPVTQEITEWGLSHQSCKTSYDLWDDPVGSAHGMSIWS